jgi:hypothetical protein
VFSEVQKINEFEGDYRGGIKIDFWGTAVVEGLFPAENAKTPLIASFEAGEGEFRPCSHEIISLLAAEF